MAPYKEFGYKDKPETCLWCGAKLRHIRIPRMETVTKPDGHQYIQFAGQVNAYDKPGWDGTGQFCRQMCAAQFGMQAAKTGTRFQVKAKAT